MRNVKGQFVKGNTPWFISLGWKNPTNSIPHNKGKKYSEFYRQNSKQWKGNKVSYRSLHKWVICHRGLAIKCEHCGKEKTTPKSIQWANKSHKYKRILTDWISLCASCHAKYDGNRGRHKKTGENQ